MKGSGFAFVALLVTAACSAGPAAGLPPAVPPREAIDCEHPPPGYECNSPKPGEMQYGVAYDMGDPAQREIVEQYRQKQASGAEQERLVDSKSDYQLVLENRGDATARFSFFTSFSYMMCEEAMLTEMYRQEKALLEGRAYPLTEAFARIAQDRSDSKKLYAAARKQLRGKQEALGSLKELLIAWQTSLDLLAPDQDEKPEVFQRRADARRASIVEAQNRLADDL